MVFRNKQQQGFTLIEMIVALGVFSVVITIAVGALLTVIATNKQLQNEQSVMTNLSFALDSMTREIRTGTAYYCVTSNNTTGNHNPGSIPNVFDDSNNVDNIGILNNDCHDGRNPDSNRYQGVAFIETGDSITDSSERILYFFDKDEGKIYRRVGSDPAQPIVSSGIFINNAEFFVTGSNKLNAGSGADFEDQASVTIFIEAFETDDVTQKPYRIQTTVTQRTLDL